MFKFRNIDIDDVMERLDGNEELFKLLLRKFYTNHSKDYETIENLLAEGMYKDAYVLVHTIKGASGNLGMKKLYDSSSSLCTIIKNGSYDKGKVYFRHFEIDFKNIIEEIREFI